MSSNDFCGSTLNYLSKRLALAHSKVTFMIWAFTGQPEGKTKNSLLFPLTCPQICCKIKSLIDCGNWNNLQKEYWPSPSTRWKIWVSKRPNGILREGLGHSYFGRWALKGNRNLYSCHKQTEASQIRSCRQKDQCSIILLSDPLAWSSFSSRSLCRKFHHVKNNVGTREFR